MPIVSYAAIIEKGAMSYGLIFPDLPGCVSVADSVDALARGGAEALALHLRGLLEDGAVLPDPTPIDALEVPAEVEHDAGRLLVTAELPGRAVRINITMEEGLLAQVDRAAQAAGLKRSGFLAAAARSYLTR